MIHIIFSTKARVPLLCPEVRDELFAYIAGIAKGESATLHAVGGIEDHVHLLITLPRTATIAAIVEAFKSSSSKWIKSKGDQLRFFAWQSVYGAFSVSHSQFDVVRNYIRNRESHHRRQSFQDEMRAFLLRHEIVYDERYIWG